MERIDRDWAREILDMELKIAFKGNDRDTAWIWLIVVIICIFRCIHIVKGLLD